MRPKNLNSIPNDLKALRVRIDRWRETRPKPRAMPEELWQAAVLLTQKYTIQQVSRALNVEHSTLKRRASITSHLPQAPVDGAPGKVGFVELSPSSIFGVPQASESLIQLEGTDGAKLSIHLPSTAPLELLELVHAFWSRTS